MIDSRALLIAASYYGIGVSQAFKNADTLRKSSVYSVARIRVAWREIKYRIRRRYY
ncbi:hypothetical protein M3626_21040 [Psychrobacillus sp. MER TA 17]|nr:hypothetical protein [Psychrobacillus sp. MER TA 17]